MNKTKYLFMKNGQANYLSSGLKRVRFLCYDSLDKGLKWKGLDCALRLPCL
jgi:hypothetical protein